MVTVVDYMTEEEEWEYESYYGEDFEAEVEAQRQNEPAPMPLGNCPLPFAHPTVGDIERAGGSFKHWINLQFANQTKDFNIEFDREVIDLVKANTEWAGLAKKSQMLGKMQPSKKHRKKVSEAASLANGIQSGLRKHKAKYQKSVEVSQTLVLYYLESVKKYEKKIKRLEAERDAAIEENAPLMAAFDERVDYYEIKEQAEYDRLEKEDLQVRYQKLVKWILNQGKTPPE